MILKKKYFRVQKEDTLILQVSQIKAVVFNVPNMNMFFNYEISQLDFSSTDMARDSNMLFNQNGATFCVEYPDEIQVEFSENLTKLLTNINMNNNNKAERNIKACALKNYFLKILSTKVINQNECQTDDQEFKNKNILKDIQTFIDDSFEISINILNRLSKCYKSDGFFVFNKNECTSFKNIAASLCTDEKIKREINRMQFNLPGYDFMIPKVTLEYRERTYDERLKKFAENNIDSSQEYPCLNEFKEFLNLDMFSKEHFSINEPNNSFTLKNCWMIQGLGTLKLLTDIDQDKVLEGFEFIGVEYSEKSNDGERFYKRINKESKNEEMPKKILNNYFKKLLNLEETKAMKEINNCKLYKLQNISTILAYNAIKYFYHVIRVKGNGQLGFDMSKYEIEEVDKVCNIRIEIDQAYKIIHSKNYCEVLFSIAENNNSSNHCSSDKTLLIICKRLKLKSEIEDSRSLNKASTASSTDFQFKPRKIKSEFFLPGFLPIYASMPDCYKEFFEKDYQNMRNSICRFDNGRFEIDKSILEKDLVAAAKNAKNYDFSKQLFQKIFNEILIKS